MFRVLTPAGPGTLTSVMDWAHRYRVDVDGVGALWLHDDVVQPLYPTVSLAKWSPDALPESPEGWRRARADRPVAEWELSSRRGYVPAPGWSAGLDCNDLRSLADTFAVMALRAQF